MEEIKHAFGIIGLGTMGRNLLLNMADHGFSVAGYDPDREKIALLTKEGAGKPVRAFGALSEFISGLQKPRSVMLLVPAGKIVDSVIEELLPLLEEGDLIVDGGNSHFTDTSRRAIYLEEKGLNFFGMGVSGGEEGARKGPSMMPGGNKEAYGQVKHIFESIAAKVNGEPCVAYIGPGAAGHFVKMVHNGIEYGLMQLISETYEILKKGLKLEHDAIQKVFAQWNEGRLQSFLIEITKDIFSFKQPGAEYLLLDAIKDEARSKGTGKWTSQVAMDLQLSTTVIDTAVSMRDLSKYKSLRMQISEVYGGDKVEPEIANADEYLANLEKAFYFAMVITYAQGMHLLSRASDEYHYELNFSSIASIWKGGCIIRSRFLDNIFDAFAKDNKLAHLLLDPAIKSLMNETLAGARMVVSNAIAGGLAIPAFAAAVSYFDVIRSGRMPSNLLQAQRDYFGAHTYELIGQEGVFHTEWNPNV